LPVVKVGEADPVGELQNGDELRHAWELRLARRAIASKQFCVLLVWRWHSEFFE
jgi:hypothetical protein